MHRAVLVPVDASSFAEHAIPYGLAVARRTGAVLHLALVQVSADMVGSAYPLADVVEPVAPEERERGADYLEDLARRIGPPDLEVRTALLRGRPPEALSRYAREQGVSMVVMTTHGRGGLQRAWLGSTTDSMVRQCGAPILLIRPTDETREVGPSSGRLFRQVVAALDGSEAAEQALESALSLCVAADASVVLTHVLAWGAPPEAGYLPQTVHLTQDQSIEGESRMRDYLARVAGGPELKGRTAEVRVVADYEAAAAILDLADSLDADLLVLGTHGRSGLRRLILGSVADKVIRGTERAVFVLRCVRGDG